MATLETLAAIVFPVALGSFQLASEQSRTPIFERVGMFRSEAFISIVFFPSLIMMLGSGILLLLHSWVLLVALFIGTAILYTIIGRFLLIRAWYLPFSLLAILLTTGSLARSEVVDFQKLALKAEKLNIDGDYSAVIKLLEPHADRRNNQNTSFFNELGLAYGKLGSRYEDIALWKKAYDCHKKAYRLDPAEPTYMFNLAMSATWLGKYKEAIDLFTEYVESGHTKERDTAFQVLQRLGAIR